MPTLGWLRRPDLPLDAKGRSYIDAPTLDQILDQMVNWRGDVNAGGYKLIGLTQSAPGNIEVGGEQTGDHAAWIDLVGDDTYVDYGLRIIRNAAGEDATSDIIHRGNGNLQLMTTEAAPISFYVGVTEALRITGAGIRFPDGSIQTAAGIPVTRQILTGYGLTGGGDLTADRTLSVVDNTSVQKVHAAINGAQTSTPNARRMINFVAGANVTISGADNAGSDRVDLTIASTGGPGGSQTPWATDIEGNNKSLTGANQLSGLAVHVKGASGATVASEARFDFSGGAGRLLVSGADAATRGNLRFYQINATSTDVAEVFSIAGNSGNTGIGVSAPGYKLDVAGDCNITGTYRVSGVPISTGTGQAQTPWLSHIDAAAIYELRNVSRIGVGTASPATAIHAYGASLCQITAETGSGYGQLRLKSDNHMYQVSVGGTATGAVSGCWYVFDETGGGSRLLIDTTGKVSIGTGTPAPSNILSVHEAQADAINSGVSPVATTWRRGLMVQGAWGANDGGCIQIGSGSLLSWAIKSRIQSGPEGLLSFYGYRNGTGNMHQVMSLEGVTGDVIAHNNLIVQGTITANVGNFNVMAYGAKGDGATNDVASIQAAVDAAVAAGGGVVYFPSGRTYLVNGTVLIRGANINISAYGAIFLNTVGSVIMFLHDQHGGGFSHFKFLGGLFRSTVAGANGVVGIRCQGDTDGIPCPRMLTIRDVDFENINFGVFIDKCDQVVVDNIKCYGNTQLYAGSTTDTGAQAYSHGIVFSNIFYYPPGDGSNPAFSASSAGGGYDPAFLTFQRVGGGAIQHIYIGTLRGAADGIQLVNDSQGIHMDGLIVQAKWGLRFVQTNMGSGFFAPLSNTVNGLDIDMYGVCAIHVGAGVLDTRIKNCGITGYNVALGTEQHGILIDAGGDTLVQGCWFQNIKRGNGILLNTGAHRTFLSDNYFADNSMNGSCIHIAAGITNCYVSANFRSSLDASAVFINNLAGAGATVTNNYPTQAVVVLDEGE